MDEVKFTPYQGWEEDIRAAATLLRAEPISFRDKPRIFALSERLLAAFEPPKCGLRLHHTAGPDSDTPVLYSHSTPGGGWLAGDALVCKLPAGHHPFVRRFAEGTVLFCAFCRGVASDPIHAPTHVPDVPDGSWQ